MQFREDDVRAYIQGIMGRHRIPGMAVGAARDGTPFFTEGFGYRDREEELPATPTTIFGVGSVTKSVTALATMQLADRGELSPGDPVQKWLPEFRLPGGADAGGVKIHHFLSHTSGLPSMPSRFYAQLRDIRRDPNADRMNLAFDPGEIYPIDTFEELMDLVAEMDYEVLGPPGAQFSYSNEAYGLLAAIIERASGQGYADFVGANIFEPLGMTRSGFDPGTVEAMGEVTQLYAATGEGEDKDVFAAPGWWEKNAMYGCGHMKSCVRDLLRYLEVYRGNGLVDGERIASAEAIERMTAPQVEIAPGLHYGYGLQVLPDYLGLTIVRHGGSDKGVAAQVGLVRDLDVTFAAQANLTNIPIDRVALAVVHAAGGLELDAEPTKPEIDIREDRLERYQGSFRSGEGASISFAVKDGELVARFAGGERTVVFHDEDSATVIVDEDVSAPVRFLFDDAGAVRAIHMRMREIPRVG